MAAGMLYFSRMFFFLFCQKWVILMDAFDHTVWDGQGCAGLLPAKTHSCLFKRTSNVTFKCFSYCVFTTILCRMVLKYRSLSNLTRSRWKLSSILHEANAYLTSTTNWLGNIPLGKSGIRFSDLGDHPYLSNYCCVSARGVRECVARDVFVKKHKKKKRISTICW